MATLTKKHMLFGAELVALKWKEVRRAKHAGMWREAMNRVIEAEALTQGFTTLFGSFNEGFNVIRFADACECLPAHEIEEIKCMVAGVPYVVGATTDE
jgi:predicted secreted protein